MTIDPTRSINITADGNTIPHYMAALYHNISSQGAQSATITAGGSGYTLGDVVLDSSGGGTSRKLAEFYVASETAGVVQSVTIWKPGEYSVLPGNPMTTSNIAVTGTPSGLTLNVTYGANSLWSLTQQAETEDTGLASVSVNSSGDASSPATGVLTFTGQPLDTETVTIDAKVYTFQSVLTDVNGNVLIGVDTSTSIANLKAALGLEAGAGSSYALSMSTHLTTAATNTATTLTAIYATNGTIGNGVGSTETLTDASWGGATLSGGSNGYALDDILSLDEAGAISQVAATVKVTSVNGSGQITGVSVEGSGSYSANPATQVGNTASGGGGTGAALNLTFGFNSKGPGSYSFVMRSPGGGLEICFIAEEESAPTNNPAVPGLTQACVGLNPDGGSDPILDPSQPWNSSENFSGESLTSLKRSWIPGAGLHNQFIWWEWPDAVALLHKDENRTYHPRGFQAGNLFRPPLSSTANSGKVRFDGLGTLGYRPRTDLVESPGLSTDSSSWLRYHVTNLTRRSICRVGTGKVISTTTASSWTVYFSNVAQTSTVNAELTGLGPDNDYHPSLFACGFHTGTRPRALGLFYTRLCLVTEYTAANTIFRSGGVSIAMSVSHDGTSEPLAMPVAAGFVLNP